MPAQQPCPGLLGCWPGMLARVLFGAVCCMVLWAIFSPALAEDTLGSLSQALTDITSSFDTPVPEWGFSEENIPAWQQPEKGLELGLFPAKLGEQEFEVVVLRIDPAHFTFAVYTVSQSGTAFSLPEWAQRQGLVAAINASMYLPDGVTSTGYLRSGEVVNNGRIVSRFGAFFVADPFAGRDASLNLPRANVLDRTVDAWEALLPQYRMVVQSYRLISADRRVLWTPGGPRHSIAAVGRDGAGRILFFLCREPLTGVEFGQLLLALPIDIHVVMYAEGGSQAGLLLDSFGYKQVWMGGYFTTRWILGNPSAPLPNVIGVRRLSLR